MMCFRRFPTVGLVLAAAALVVIVAVATLTTWWVLLAVIPPTMMVACIAMMVVIARWMPGNPGAARWGCCGVTAPITATDPEAASEPVHPAHVPGGE